MARGNRGKCRLVCLAIAVVGLTVAACPLGATAKPAKTSRHSHAGGLFGTTILEPTGVEEFQRMSAGGLSSVRLIITDVFVESQPGHRDWRAYDRVVGDAARAGITIDPTLFGVPGWISPTPATLPIHGAAQQNFWFGFVRDAAHRYGPGGQFWAQNPGIPAHPITDWEVWNEPNVNLFAGQTTPLKPRDYAKLLRITRSALNAAGRGNRIVVAGLYRRPKPGFGTSMTRFLRGLYKVRGGRSLFDAVGIHPYAARPLQVLRVIQRARRVMDANRDAGKPIWITELGWTTGGNYWAQSLYHATLAQQATRVRRTARLLIANRSRLRLARVIWFSWRDRGGTTDDFWDKHMGFFTADGYPKPAWPAFTQVTGGFAGGQIKTVGHAQPFAPTPPPGGGGSTKPPPQKPPNNCLLPGILC